MDMALVTNNNIDYDEEAQITSALLLHADSDQSNENVNYDHFKNLTMVSSSSSVFPITATESICTDYSMGNSQVSNIKENKNDNDIFFELETWNGWCFRVHSTEEVSCYPLHREINWSYVNKNKLSKLSSESSSHGNGLKQDHSMWGVHSEVMLDITFRPSYQSLHSYTAVSTTRRLYRQASARMCCRSSHSKKNVQFTREVYTWEDILDIKVLTKTDNHDDYFVQGIGPCKAVEIILKSKRRGDNPSVTFALPKVDDSKHYEMHCPPLIWKAKIPRDPSIGIETVTVFDGKLVNTMEGREKLIQDLNNIENNNGGPTHIYCNGWQSWSFAGSIRQGEHRPQSAMPRVVSKAFNRGGKFPPPGIIHVKQDALNRLRNSIIRKELDQASTTDLDFGISDQILPERKAAFYKSEFFSCLTSRRSNVGDSRAEDDQYMMDQNGGFALVIGWLSQRRQFGVVAVDEYLRNIAMYSPCDGAIAEDDIETDWAYCQILAPKSYGDEPMADYLESVADYCNARKVKEPLSVGWCSWYHYYEKIDEKTLRKNFQQMHQFKLKFDSNVAVIDDGYMVSWGDWESFKPNKFCPETMKNLARMMKSSGMRPGLWLAPFACDKNSKLAQLHPDWIIRNHHGASANSANCGKFFYGLDATNPEVLEHAAKIVRKAVFEWGFEVLKLDFLYASCLQGNGKFDMSKSRAEAMHLALKTVREAAGENTFIIGCGCPLGPAVGMVDGMRISADTGPTWKPAFPLPSWDWSTLPCLFAMIRNSLTRMGLGYRWWHNDPDCLLLGESTSLTVKEVTSAATVIAMSGGMLLLSDDLPALSRDRLDIASKLFPITGASAIPLDLHCTDKILPSKLRVWCRDKEHFNQMKNGSLLGEGKFSDRGQKRNSIIMAEGLGNWGCISVSNWREYPDSLRIPLSSFFEESNESLTINHQNGYHAFSFWNQSYVWIPRQQSFKSRSVSKLLGPHESEIFHIKHVQDKVQYIGSDFHFSCGFEVEALNVNVMTVSIRLKLLLQRFGYLFVFIPYDCEIDVTMSGIKYAASEIMKVPMTSDVDTKLKYGKVFKIPAEVKLDGSVDDGHVLVEILQ